MQTAMKCRRSFWMVVLGVMAVTCTASLALGATGDEGRIAFVSDRSGSWRSRRCSCAQAGGSRGDAEYAESCPRHGQFYWRPNGKRPETAGRERMKRIAPCGRSGLATGSSKILMSWM